MMHMRGMPQDMMKQNKYDNLIKHILYYFSKKIEAGIVWVNTWVNRDLRTPFGGIKNSGVGREGGFEALKFFTEPKNICIKYDN